MYFIYLNKIGSFLLHFHFLFYYTYLCISQVSVSNWSMCFTSCLLCLEILHPRQLALSAHRFPFLTMLIGQLPCVLLFVIANWHGVFKVYNFFLEHHLFVRIWGGWMFDLTSEETGGGGGGRLRCYYKPMSSCTNFQTIVGIQII